MRAVDLITKKRNGGTLLDAEIKFFIQGYIEQIIPDYQVSALLMAIYFSGMQISETACLTQAMIDSGDKYQFPSISSHLLVDKHSTGGVGDKISLILAPLAASMGLHVPMISGRALGITGGTLDKLESIPGYTVTLSEQKFVDLVTKQGYAMSGQSASLVPADRLLYALRDVTGTVESIPLITASILSKKLAEGARNLVLDIKFGCGAFMKNTQDAEKLAQSLLAVSSEIGLNTTCLLTNMNQPLGMKVGNLLEIEETIACLCGEGPSDIMDLVLTQAGYMAHLAGIVTTPQDGIALAQTKLDSKIPLDLWWRNIELQGGRIDDYEALAQRKVNSHIINSPVSGYLHSIDAGIIGQAGTILGVGRNQKTDTVDPWAGFEFYHKSPQKVKKGEPLCIVYGQDEKKLQQACLYLSGQATFTISENIPIETPLILKELSNHS
ncbi:MAG: thymidine phosphorylase [Spirochaetia bacterium]